MLINTHTDANMQLTINSFCPLFADKIFGHFSLTFPGELSKSVAFPGKWSLCRMHYMTVITMPRTKLITIGDRAFGVAAERVGDDLPSSVIDMPSMTVFKKRLKIYLFNHVLAALGL